MQRERFDYYPCHVTPTTSLSILVIRGPNVNGWKALYDHCFQLTKTKSIGCVYVEERTIRNVPAMPFAMMMGAINTVMGFIAGIIMAIFLG